MFNKIYKIHIEFIKYIFDCKNDISIRNINPYTRR